MPTARRARARRRPAAGRGRGGPGRGSRGRGSQGRAVPGRAGPGRGHQNERQRGVPVRSVVIAGGGSGGHIEPAMALADALRRLAQDVRITCLGTERGLETKVIPARGYALDLIPAVPLPRSLTPALLAVPGKMLGAVRAAMDVLDRADASVLVGFGGYVATPGYLAARRRRVPIVVHEANPRPGLANRIGALLTRHVYLGQAGTRLPHARYIGIPIRREIAALDRLALSEKARRHFGLRPDLPVLLVTGGSQGAASLNRAVLGAADAILSVGVQVP